ncbi:hypothetical protein LQ327_06360 [Actinomycetospora endophytica]|uniref:Uncharacterized protein n=1 Tax=Actinomycetospora endophytica TaxID=2291215 RepID=A0ABS8P452_9PSEU|nr:hypothetical protein [Actinomycetospora endophytica]MCD2193011.1 hypothetical protein [Actinomycetospora endophytica]
MTSTEPRADLTPAPVLPTLDAPETVASRRALREQVTALGEELRRTLAADWTSEALTAARGGSPGGPRLLGLGELEALRDDLLAHLDDVRAVSARREEEHVRARALLQAMYDDPGAHRGVRLTTDDLGLPGCCRWQVRPVLGVVGRLAGWWRVKVSSGCP